MHWEHAGVHWEGTGRLWGALGWKWDRLGHAGMALEWQLGLVEEALGWHQDALQ